jgi:hypoxanthine-guanine phosphoribosyltransferase
MGLDFEQKYRNLPFVAVKSHFTSFKPKFRS